MSRLVRKFITYFKVSQKLLNSTFLKKSFNLDIHTNEHMSEILLNSLTEGTGKMFIVGSEGELETPHL